MPLPRPVPPVQPELEDCCRSGCTPCVFDLYEEALARYERELKVWEAAQAAQVECDFAPWIKTRR